MVGTTVGNRISEKNLPKQCEKYGQSLEEIFFEAFNLRETYDGDFEKLHPGAIGFFTYFQRVGQGVSPHVGGARKIELEDITRGDLASLTKEAADISGIPYVTELDKEQAWEIIKS